VGFQIGLAGKGTATDKRGGDTEIGDNHESRGQSGATSREAFGSRTFERSKPAMASALCFRLCFNRQPSGAVLRGVVEVSVLNQFPGCRGFFNPFSNLSLFRTSDDGWVESSEKPKPPNIEAIRVPALTPIEIDRDAPDHQFDAMAVRVNVNTVDPLHSVQTGFPTNRDPIA
jgi:hypothetical protein